MQGDVAWLVAVAPAWAMPDAPPWWALRRRANGGMIMNDEIQVPTWAIALGELSEKTLALVSKFEEHVDITDLPDYALRAMYHLTQAGAELSLVSFRGLSEAKPSD